MNECSICGLPMLHEGDEYYDGQLAVCGDGHIAQVSCDAESEPRVAGAELASEWVLRLVHAFPDKERKQDARAMAAAVRALERRAEEGGEHG